MPSTYARRFQVTTTRATASACMDGVPYGQDMVPTRALLTVLDSCPGGFRAHSKGAWGRGGKFLAMEL